MRIGAVILSNSNTLKHYNLTKQTISTLKASEPNLDIDILVVENNTCTHLFNISEKESEQGFYGCGVNDKVSVIFRPQPFNFNRFLNMGIERLKAKHGYDIILMLNNDLIFHKGWLSEIIKAFNKDKALLSASPYTDNWHCHKEFENKQGIIYGYRKSWEFGAWCHVVKKEFFDTFESFDESFTFFYSDDDIEVTMKQKGIKHGLVRESIITHLCSQSHDIIPNDKKEEFYSPNGFIRKYQWT